ncbi:MAG: nucleotide pyrophosphohydrolase [Gammaproteobacteria bacterium]|nr:nucleotide pyrophosphohydrolase [Gammaproteobacteria bacterium]
MNDVAVPPRQLRLDLREALRDFASARDWDPFHRPRNLATALSVEAHSLKHFPWLHDRDADHFDELKRARVGEELADVRLYLIRLADKLDLNLIAEARRKLELNAAKYPIELATGSPQKYPDL